FADAARVIDESVLMKIVHRTTLSQSPFDRGLLTAAMTAALKGPLYVLAAVTACITHIVLLQWMPDRIAPVKPLAYGMVLAFGAFTTVTGFITTRNSATATAYSSAGTANTRKS